MTNSILPLELKDLRYKVGNKELIKGVSCRLAAGRRSIVLGPNGAGKSLFMRLCHGLLKPTGGEVRWAKDDRNAQAMVFQRPVMLRRTALANVEYALGLRGCGKGECRDRAREVLERTGLTKLGKRPARVLSGGEQQRLALARAWALNPDVLFLDEPTASLDPAATKAVEELIQSIFESGTRIIMSTHDLGQAKRLADEVLFFHRGRLVEHSAAEQFFSQPEAAAAQAYLAGEIYI